MTSEQTAERTGADQSAGPDQTDKPSLWDRLPLRVALLAVASVWVVGCVWSFEEQTRFAQSKAFEIPQLLPVVIDGLAIALAAVAYAASLDGRPAVFARLGTGLAIAGSATSNAAWAWERSGADPGTVALAIAVPVAANLAFEVLLAESRRQTLRRRGVPAPVAVPYPRAVRIVLAPWSTFTTWRRLVLEATDLRSAFDAARAASRTAPGRSRPVQTEKPAKPAAPEQTASAADPTPTNGRTAPRKQTAAVPVRTLHAVRSDRHSPTAIADARTIRARYKDRRPGRNEVVREMEWGAEKASKALKALDADADLEDAA